MTSSIREEPVVSTPKPGDMVRLKSGGPTMTVLGLADKPEKQTFTDAIREQQEKRRLAEANACGVQGSDPVMRSGLKCGWFVGSRLVKSDFPVDALEVVEQEETQKDK